MSTRQVQIGVVSILLGAAWASQVLSRAGESGAEVADSHSIQKRSSLGEPFLVQTRRQPVRLGKRRQPVRLGKRSDMSDDSTTGEKRRQPVRLGKRASDEDGQDDEMFQKRSPIFDGFVKGDIQSWDPSNEIGKRSDSAFYLGDKRGAFGYNKMRLGKRFMKTYSMRLGKRLPFSTRLGKRLIVAP